MKNKIVCIIIGSIYLLSGIGKVINVIAFEMLIANYGFELFQIFAPFIILSELALGVCLVLWIKPKLMSLLSMILLVIFTIVFTYAHFKNGINDCGCFGMFNLTQQSPIFTYIRNILLFGMSLFVFIKSSKENSLIENWKKYSIIAFFIPIIFICGFTFRIPQNLYKIKQHQYLNKPIKETILSNYLQTAKDSSYLIYCFSYTCPHCWNSIENYKSFKTTGMVDSIIAISFVTADASINSQNRNVFTEHFGTNLVNYELINDGIIQTIISSVPTSFYIENDTIKQVIESELPSPFIFQKFIKNRK
ncbi:MAG: hypothetical protein FWF46_09305 [Oscillospiraceae bacterium]|nr:hypothetical protein [Oscillospiraceae bacterium]